MKAALIEGFQGIAGVKLGEVDKPEPMPEEVQIQVYAVSVNPVDWKIPEGVLKDRLPHQFPLILGWDVSGVVSVVGSQVKTLKVGDEVYAYCRKPVVQWGTFAEYVCFDAAHVVLKPTNVSFVQAAALPLVSLTAWQALFDVAGVEEGQKVLVHAGAGGVGSMAIQFAKYIGAKVSTTASKKNHDYVNKLGADIAIDYTKEDFVKKVKTLSPEGVDMVLDCVGGDTLTRSVDCVKPGGWLVSIVAKPDSALVEEKHIQGGYVFVRPNGEQLLKLKNLIEGKKVVAPEIREMPFQKVVDALKLVKTEHTRGKIALTLKNGNQDI